MVNYTDWFDGLTLPWGPPCLLYSGHWFSSRVQSGRGVVFSNHPLHPAPRWKKG